MGNYAYKDAESMIPARILDEHDTDPHYDGGLWDAAAEYMEELEAKLKVATHFVENVIAYGALRDEADGRKAVCVLDKLKSDSLPNSDIESS